MQYITTLTITKIINIEYTSDNKCNQCESLQ